MTDESLAALIRSAPEKGLAIALKQYGNYCATILRRMLGNREQDIEDCLSTVFCKLWQTIEQYEPQKGSIKSWLCRITRNTAVDRLRSTGLETFPLEDELTEFFDNPAEWVQRNDTAKLVQQAVDSLGEPDRTIFIRRYYYLERLSTIANALSLTEKAVERRLAKGRQKLKEYLLEKGVNM